MATNNLSWRTEISYSYPEHQVSQDWIRVNPPNGVGTQDVGIITDPSRTYQDPDTAGTVTFICTDCPENRKVQVNVTRCAQTECTYEPTGVTTYSAGEFSEIEVEACDKSTDDITIESITVYKSTNGCPDSSVTKSYTTAYTFSANETSDAVTYVFYYPGQDVDGYATITVNQAAGPCTTCGCGQISYSETSLSWDWDETDYKYSTVSVDPNCSSIISLVTATTTGDFTVELNDNVIKVKPNGQNAGTGGDNTGAISIKYTKDDVEKTCNSVIELTQTSEGCTCGKLKISKDLVNIVVGSTDTVNVSADCTTNISVRSNDASVATSSYGDDVITITGVGAGDAIVNINYKANGETCKKEISVNVTCPTITFNPDNGSGYGGEEPVRITITES